MKKIAVIVLLTCTTIAYPAEEAKKKMLRVYLPRNVIVNTEKLTLGLLCVIRGKDAGLLLKAAEIPMGRAPWSREKIIFDRKTILTRLVASGIPAELVKLAGAEQVTVIRNEKLIPAKTILERAESFLENTLKDEGIHSWRVFRLPKDLSVPPVENVKLDCKIASDSPTGYVKVEVLATDGKRRLGQTTALFKVMYDRKQFVATRDITPGEAITPQNVKTLKVASADPDRRPFKPPYGRIAARRIRAGTVLTDALLRDVEEILIKRNQNVTMKIEGYGFFISCLGQALEDGRLGETIKVRNVDSNRIIIAKVTADGSVMPIGRGR